MNVTPDPPILPPEYLRPYQLFTQSLMQAFGFSVSPHSYLRLCLDAADAEVKTIQSERRVKVVLEVRTVRCLCVYDCRGKALLKAFKLTPHPDRGRKASRQGVWGPGPYKRHPKHRGQQP